MNGKFLLDTNIIIALFAQDRSVIDHLRDAAEVFVPVIAAGELYFGAYRSGRVEANLQKLQEFVADNTVLACDGETANFYGQVRNGLCAKGKPIPENDVWIAAIALQHQLAVVTRDAHFGEIDGLQIEAW